MTTSELKGRFLLNESIRIDSHNESQSNRIDSNRELECSITCYPAEVTFPPLLQPKLQLVLD